jgi:GntR family transcriptional repressor for pyruvate dehydrogenase complex
LFETVKDDKLLSDRVVDQIVSLVKNKELTPGDRLPPERDLAEQLGVSRTVVREALKVLRAKGLVDVQHGSGVVVTSLSPDHVIESMSLFLESDNGQLEYRHIAELRQIVEIEIAGLAARRAGHEHIQCMEQEFSTMEALSKCVALDQACRQQFSRADVQFHLALAMATGNPLLLVLFKPLVNTLTQQRFRAMDQPGAIEQALVYHQELLDAVKAGDSLRAQNAMREHLEQSSAIMERVELAST